MTRSRSSATLIEPVEPMDWRYWSSRGGRAVSVSWNHLLRKPLDEAVERLSTPIRAESEAGDGHRELGSTMAARPTRRPPDLRETNAVGRSLPWPYGRLRGPVPKVLGDAYRDVADLVMIESYVGSKKYLIGGSPPRLKLGSIFYGDLAQDDHGLGNRLRWPPRRGVGTDQGGTRTTNPLRVRPLTGGSNHRASASLAAGEWPHLVVKADEISLTSHFYFPTHGSGLPEDLLAFALTFIHRHEKPTLVCSPHLSNPTAARPTPSILVEPEDDAGLIS